MGHSDLIYPNRVPQGTLVVFFASFKVNRLQAREGALGHAVNSRVVEGIYPLDPVKTPIDDL